MLICYFVSPFLTSVLLSFKGGFTLPPTPLRSTWPTRSTWLLSTRIQIRLRLRLRFRHCLCCLFLSPSKHRWELPVLRYHSIRGNFSVILHDFIRQNYHKNQSDHYHFPLIMVNYPIFLIDYHILYFQMYYQYIFFLPKYPNNILKEIQKIIQFLE